MSLDYNNKNLVMLTAFNMAIAIERLLSIIMQNSGMKAAAMLMVTISIACLVLMGVLLILVLRRLFSSRYAFYVSLCLFAVYLWLSFNGRRLDYDTGLNLGFMVMAFSIISIWRILGEENDWKLVCEREPIILDLRIPNRNQLFHPMVIGPHLEISPEIVNAVDNFVKVEKDLSPLELYIHCGAPLSGHMQETAIEAYQLHYIDEERRIRGVLDNSTHRSMILFCISIIIMFLWARFSDLFGDSPVWMILGNMGGFFLWEIGNTYLRHLSDFKELEQATVSRTAEITFFISRAKKVPAAPKEIEDEKKKA